MMTSARMVTPGQAMATIPMMRASTPIRIKEVDVDLNAVGIALASMAFLRVFQVLRIASAGEERQQFGQELAGVLQMRDVAALGYHHPGGAGDVAGGRGRQGAEVAEPGGLGRGGVLAER